MHEVQSFEIEEDHKTPNQTHCHCSWGQCYPEQVRKNCENTPGSYGFRTPNLNLTSEELCDEDSFL